MTMNMGDEAPGVTTRSEWAWEVQNYLNGKQTRNWDLLQTDTLPHLALLTHVAFHPYRSQLSL